MRIKKRWGRRDFAKGLTRSAISCYLDIIKKIFAKAVRESVI